MKTVFCIGLIIGIIAFIPSTGCKTKAPQTSGQTNTIILNLPHVR